MSYTWRHCGIYYSHAFCDCPSAWSIGLPLIFMVLLISLTLTVSPSLNISSLCLTDPFDHVEYVTDAKFITPSTINMIIF